MEPLIMIAVCLYATLVIVPLALHNEQALNNYLNNPESGESQ